MVFLICIFIRMLKVVVLVECIVEVLNMEI